MRIAIALVFALISTTLVNLAYLREQQAAAAMPALSLHHPSRSVRMLLASHGWMKGFALESGGFLLYASALALAPLALVQSVAAGGIGLLALMSRRVAGHTLTRRTMWGVGLSVTGLIALSASLAKGSGEGHAGSTLLILIWLGATGAAAGCVLLLSDRIGPAVANGIAGGLCFSIGDISTKLATQWGDRSAFVVTLVIGYLLGTTLLQLGYQAGAALTVAGLATLLTNALPIVAGTVVLEEPVPSGALGVARVIAFVAVSAGGVLFARPVGGGERRAAASEGTAR